MEKDIVLCLKINKKVWIEKLQQGSICFNRAGRFIGDGEENKNGEQGDRFEGVFARLPENDPRIEKYKASLGEDIEIIDDGSYVFLRRPSVKDIPIFCIFGVKKDDLEPLTDKPVSGKDGQLHIRAKYLFPPRMYDEFLDAKKDGIEINGYFASPDHLLGEIEEKLKNESKDYIKRSVAYDIDLTQEFELPLDDSYSELFHKRKDFVYQHEIRFVLPTSPTKDKLLFDITPLPNTVAGIAKKTVDGMEFDLTLK